MTDPQRYSPIEPSTDAEKSRPLWHYYVGITALLLVMVVALTGGIIWYNSKKTSELAIAAAERMMLEAGEDVLNRIKLLYDPMYAIVGIASLVPELTSPAIKENPHALSLMLHVLRIYPQILSLYIGFDNGEFFMVTHITGENSAVLRDALHAPPMRPSPTRSSPRMRVAPAARGGYFSPTMAPSSGAAMARPSILANAPGTTPQNAAMPSSGAIFTFSPAAASRASP